MAQQPAADRDSRAAAGRLAPCRQPRGPRLVIVEAASFDSLSRSTNEVLLALQFARVVESPSRWNARPPSG